MSNSLSSYESLVSYTVYETTHDGFSSIIIPQTEMM